jgi:hypothetical protein
MGNRDPDLIATVLGLTNTTMYSQNYNAPIQSVTNIDLGEFAGLLTKGTRLTERALLAATLLNRSSQFEAIVDRIESMVDKNGGGKLLIVLRGLRTDIHQSLVLRCGRAHFGENYDQKNGWSYLGRMTWPRGAPSVQSILRKLAQELAFPPAMRSQAAIEAQLKKLPKSICFSHYLEADWWTESDESLVLDWVDYVSDTWPEPPRGRLVIGFLCLNSGTIANDRFNNLLEGFRQRAVVGRPILLTEPLDLIAASDVDDWVSEVGRFLKLSVIEGPLLNVANEIFSPTYQRLRLADVYTPLLQRLASALPSSPIFTTADQ